MRMVAGVVPVTSPSASSSSVIRARRCPRHRAAPPAAADRLGDAGRGRDVALRAAPRIRVGQQAERRRRHRAPPGSLPTPAVRRDAARPARPARSAGPSAPAPGTTGTATTGVPERTRLVERRAAGDDRHRRPRQARAEARRRHHVDAGRQRAAGRIA